MTPVVMFDSNVYDAILAAGDAARILAAPLSLVTTAVQDTELRQIADAGKRSRLLALHEALGGDEVTVELPPEASRDAVLAAAAKAWCDVFVTGDRALAATLAEDAPELRVLDYPAFRAAYLD
jgi:hypothetical protein